MAKRKEVCVMCGVGSQQLHSMCVSCHEQDFDGLSEQVIARVGNDYFTRCDEKDCWICSEYKYKLQKRYNTKFSKRYAINMKNGRYGKKNKELGREAINLIKQRERFFDEENDFNS